MYLTQQDLLKVEQWLKARSVKDTDFALTNNLKKTDYITIVQDGINKKILISDIILNKPGSKIPAENVIVSSELEKDKTQAELNKEVNDKLNIVLNSTISSKIKPNGVDVKLHIGDIYTVASIPTYSEERQTPSGLLDEYLYTDITEMRDVIIPDLEARIAALEAKVK